LDQLIYKHVAFLQLNPVFTSSSITSMYQTEAITHRFICHYQLLKQLA